MGSSRELGADQYAQTCALVKVAEYTPREWRASNSEKTEGKERLNLTLTGFLLRCLRLMTCASQQIFPEGWA